MIRRYLVLDCNYLAYRAKYVFGELSDKGSATGVIYGFLKDILRLREEFDTNRFVFCWDSHTSIRKDMYPAYKEKRRTKDYTDEEAAFEKAFISQVKRLRTKYLPAIGYKNIFFQEGYESDDIIAMVCKAITPDVEEAVIITADHDLFQLLQKNISCYNPQTRQTMTRNRFINTYGITPKEWIKVKAIAGCTSDNVQGIKRVGENTAIKYIQKELGKGCKAYKSIKTGWKDIVLRNRTLVELPLKGTKPVKLEKDQITQVGWDKVTKSLNMKSIRYESVL
jgi:DNA polymerase-1